MSGVKRSRIAGESSAAPKSVVAASHQPRGIRIP